MKALGMIFFGAVLLTGCATKEFASTPFYEGQAVKYTGKAQDRVNAWPVFYWREPVGSFAWPLVSFGGSHFALRPLYSQYGMNMSGECSEINVLWPIVQLQFDIGRRDYRIFPFYWGYDGLDDWHFSLFPAIWYNNRSAGALPFCWLTGEEEKGFFVFPLFWSSVTEDGDGFWHTLFPLYYYGAAETQSEKPESREFWFGCGLAGYDRIGDKYISHRALPFYYKGEELFWTPLYGCAGDSEWLFPFYYRDEKNFTTVIFSAWNDEATQEKGFLFVPLLSGGDWSDASGKSSWYALAGLAGSQTDETGSVDSRWLFPVFDYKKDKSFWSLPYSWDGGGTGQTNRTFACSLVEVRSGDETGWSLFPFYDGKKRGEPEKYLNYTGKDGLTAKFLCEDKAGGGKKCDPGNTCRNRAIDFFTYDNSRFCYLVDCNLSVGGCVNKKEGKYQVTYRRDLGDILVCRHEASRCVEFDAASRRMTGDVAKSGFSILSFLCKCTQEDDFVANTRHSSSKILWKLWDWENVNGDITLDVFPAFAYDSKKDGYVKASFLWRFFRYERRPEGGTDVDLLFIPVWRQGDYGDRP